MILEVVPDDNHVVRYVKPMDVRDNGKVAGSTFHRRRDEDGVSVNWIEILAASSKKQALHEVRRLIRLNLNPNGCFAEVNVGQTKQSVAGLLNEIEFVSKPRDAELNFDADPSHAEIVGLPPNPDGVSPEAALVGDLIAMSVIHTYPARDN